MTASWGAEGDGRWYRLSVKSDRDLTIELLRRPRELTPANGSEFMVSMRRGSQWVNVTPATLRELLENVDRTIDRIEEVEARGLRP